MLLRHKIQNAGQSERKLERLAGTTSWKVPQSCSGAWAGDWGAPEGLNQTKSTHL